MIFLYIPYENFKLFLDRITSLRLPKEYPNSHDCSFDINIVKISTIRWSRSGRFYIGLSYVVLLQKRNGLTGFSAGIVDECA